MPSILDPNLKSVPASQQIQPSLRTVLQVEGNPANAGIVEQLTARRSDLKLLTAINGYQGIQMACTNKPDIILINMKSPGISGLAAMVILRANPATAHIPVIALSSNAYPREIKECLKAGFFWYLTKPFHLNELMDLIDAALRFVAETRPTR